jgi:hypothetical protein
MKKTTRTLAILLFLTLFFVRCTKNEDYPDTLSFFLTEGTWNVAHFYSGNDKTAAFASYKFSFEKTGMAVSNSSTGTDNGSWKIMQKVKGDAIRLQFNDTQLQEINNDWDISVSKNSTLELNNGSAVLVLQKD